MENKILNKKRPDTRKIRIGAHKYYLALSNISVFVNIRNASVN